MFKVNNKDAIDKDANKDVIELQQSFSSLYTVVILFFL